MAFKKGMNLVQMQRDELIDYRPVIIYITAPLSSKDIGFKTPNYKHFTSSTSFPEGVLRREANPYNLCLVQVNSEMERFKEQISTCLGEYKKAAHKIVIINAHGTPDGVKLKDADEGGTEVILDGHHLAKLLSPHTDSHNLHVFIFSVYGHTFAKEFYSCMRQEGEAGASDVMAISYFTSANKPTEWDRTATMGMGNVEVTSDLRGMVKSIIKQSPYKTLDENIKP